MSRPPVTACGSFPSYGAANAFRRLRSGAVVSPVARRLLTASIALPVALAVVFFAPGDLAFAIFFIVFFLAAFEFLQMARHLAPSAPLGSLLAWIPLASVAGFLLVRGDAREVPAGWLVAAVSLVVTVAGLTTLLGRTEIRHGLAAMGILAFAVPYFAVPPIGVYWLQAIDPWLLLVFLVIVWSGDTAAWVVGNAIGRHKLAPVVSPGKSWEGAVAGLLAGLLVMAVWSLLRLGELRLELLVLAAVTAVVAQLGDLVESVIKRGAGVKDSSNLLPGHGGFFDRLDALLLATPVFVAGVQALGADTLIPP